MKLSTFDEERAQWAAGCQWVIGVDEAGRGPLAGPVVAAVACWRGGELPSDENDEVFRLVRDSKLLSEKQRTQAVKIVREYFIVGVGIVDHHTINRVNILQASFLAMKKAYTDIAQKLPKDSTQIVLVDGRDEIPQFSQAQKAIIGGDQSVKCIAAAAIIAKTTRDNMMIALNDTYPQYGFAQHKGYGTKAHMEALRKFGPSPVHRASFKPVRKILRELREYGADV